MYHKVIQKKFTNLLPPNKWVCDRKKQYLFLILQLVKLVKFFILYIYNYLIYIYLYIYKILLKFTFYYRNRLLKCKKVYFSLQNPLHIKTFNVYLCQH